MSYRPQVKSDSNGTTQDLPIDAETVQGKTPVFTTTNQTISGVKTYTETQKFIGGITLFSESGASPRLTFQRGTLIDTSKDWSLYGGSDGYLYIQQSGSSGYETRATFTTTGVDFIGAIKENGTSLVDKYSPIGHTHSQYLDATTFTNFIDSPFGFIDDRGSYDAWTYFICDELGFINTPHPTYYLHTIRAYQSSAPISSVVFNVISTQSTAYTKATLYNAFQNKVFHASGYCGSFVKADARIQYVYLDSATTIKMYHGNNIGTSQAYGGSYFADEVKRIE